jgi:plastocyanin
MKRSICITTMIVCFFVELAGLSAKPKPTPNGEKPAPSGVEVKIDNFSFGPMTVSISAGEKVTWVNRDDIPHTVMSTDKVFRSKPLDTDDKFTFTFERPGTYEYFCSLHPKMTGKVIVR